MPETERNEPTDVPRPAPSRPSRRGFLAAAAASAVAHTAFAREFGRDAAPIRYPDPVWKVVDERFRKYVINHTPLRREWTGALWAEGPAWNGIGRYVVFSDVPNNRQMRWDEVTGTVTLLRSPSSFSNGNTFDFQGRQISCEQGTARVVRYEWEGDPVVLAATYEGKLLNGPDDAVVHPANGGIIFTDPGYGSQSWYEGNVRELALPMSIYSIDAQSGTLTRLTDELLKPNGLCFSPDYRVLYVADSAPTDHPQEKARIIAWDVQDDGKALTNRRVLVTLESGIHDGLRADADGNIWAATAFGGEGVDGVHVYAADGTRIGQLEMPEACANLTFVGMRRNRVFICGSQSVYTLYTKAKGAHIT